MTTDEARLYASYCIKHGNMNEDELKAMTDEELVNWATEMIDKEEYGN